MSESNVKIEWYLARDGQPHGPLSDAELAKFRELGHLRPDDLVWRAGFEEWRAAGDVFSEQEPEAAQPPAEPSPETEAKQELVEQASLSAGLEAQDDLAAGIADTDGDSLPTASEDQTDAQISEQTDRVQTQHETEEEVKNFNALQNLDASRDYQSSEATHYFNKDVAPASQTLAEPESQGAVSEPASPSSDGMSAAYSPASSQLTAQLSAFASQPEAQEQTAAMRPEQTVLSQQAQQSYVHPQHAPPQNQPQSVHQMPGSAPNAAGDTRSSFSYEQQTGAAPPSGAYSVGQGGSIYARPDQRFNQSQQDYQGADGAGHNFDRRQPDQPYAGFQYSAGSGSPAYQAAQHQAYTTQAALAQSQQHFEDDDYDDDDSNGVKWPYLAIFASLALFACVGFGAWLFYTDPNIKKIFVDASGEPTNQSPAVIAAPSTPPGSAPTVAEQKIVQSAPVAPQKLALLSSNFWRELHNQDAEWMSRQEEAIEKLKLEGKALDERLAFAINALVDWRRGNADKILSAPPDELRELARTFVVNLKHLERQNIKACYGYISKGELSPAVLPLYEDPQHLDVLGTQAEALIAAARASSINGTQYLDPISSDFEALAQLLLKRGWTEADLKLFSDPVALSSAPEKVVCRLVTDWFDTQLRMPSGELQIRLLAKSLQPVVRG